MSDTKATKSKVAGRNRNDRQAKTRPAKPQAKERVVTLPVIETDCDDEANRILAKQIPDWGKLDKDERSELARLIRKYRKRSAPAKVKLIRKPDGGGHTIEPAGNNELLALLKLHETFSANSIDPVNARASELLKYLGSVGADSEGRYNAALSFIEGMEPQNQAEALLLVQMYVTHDAAIRALSQLGTAEWVPTVQTFGSLAAKLLRTSQAQMETLARMRRGGEQVVRHIHVDNRGGQAVIADNVHTGGQGNEKIDDQSQATGETGERAALPGPDPLRDGMPIPGRKREEAVSYARGNESGRTRGQ